MKDRQCSPPANIRWWPGMATKARTTRRQLTHNLDSRKVGVWTSTADRQAHNVDVAHGAGVNDDNVDIRIHA